MHLILRNEMRIFIDTHRYIYKYTFLSSRKIYGQGSVRETEDTVYSRYEGFHSRPFSIILEKLQLIISVNSSQVGRSSVPIGKAIFNLICAPESLSHFLQRIMTSYFFLLFKSSSSQETQPWIHREKGILASVVLSFSGEISKGADGTAEFTTNNPAQKYNMKLTEFISR